MSNLTKHIPTFAKKKAQVEYAEPSKSRILCHVGDCQQIGTFSESAGPDAKFVCWVHDRVKPEDNSRLNECIHEYRWLLNLCNRITVIPKVDLENKGSAKQIEINKFCEAKGIPQMARKKNEGDYPKTLEWEPQTQWISRFRNFTIDVLMGKVDIA